MPQTRTCRYIPLCLLCVLAAGGGDAASGSPADQAPSIGRDTLDLAPVQAERPAPLPTDASKEIIVLTDVDRQLGNLGDLLQRVAGVHVMRAGGLGDYLGVSVWGASDNQVNVYVDGVLRNQAADPSLFLSDWDMSRVERIEVSKGMAPEDLPGSPMGGTINIVTGDQARGPALQGAVGAGSFGSLRANGAVAYRGKDWRSRFQAARNQSDGDFTYYDDNGTEYEPGRHPEGSKPLSADDLTRKTRRNNAHAYSEIAGDFAVHPAPAWETGLQFDLSRLQKQIPASAPNADSSVAISAFRESDRAFARGFGKWSGPDVEASLDISGTYVGDVYVDTSKGGGAIGIGYDDDENRYTDFLASLWARKLLGGGWSLSALIAYGVSGYAFSDRIQGKEYPGIFRYTGQGKLTPAYTHGRHSVQAILAADLALEELYGQQAYTVGGELVPGEKWSDHGSLRLAYQYRPRAGLWFTAQAGDAYRVPTFMERFGDRGTVLANPRLRPEGGVNASLGAHADGDSWSLDVEAFATEGRRIITLQQNSQFVLTFRNTSATRILGLEIKASAAPRKWSRTDASVTLMRAEDISGESGTDGFKLIPYRPTTQASLRQTLTHGSWSLAAFGYWQGLAYPNSSNQPSIFDSYSHNTDWQTRCDLDLSWRIRHLLIAAGAHNVFDQRNFDYFTFPLQGRNYAATAQADF
ncbi:MAG: TonB-dependent receptor plug domain-containing protein [Fibrobacteria bacterium]